MPAAVGAKAEDNLREAIEDGRPPYDKSDHNA